MKNILVIQTAFIGDVVLATPLFSALKEKHQDAHITGLVRSGNESLLRDHRDVDDLIVWEKRKQKYQNLVKVMRQVRQRKFDAVYNLQRFAASGLITWYSGAATKVGFAKNPFAFCYSEKKPHVIGDGRHEIQRNLSLIENEPDLVRPTLYPSEADEKSVAAYKKDPYVCIAPASVWLTKQFHEKGWIDLCNALPGDRVIYLLGAFSDLSCCKSILRESNHPNIRILAGKLSLLQSAALMRDATMNYVNDSAPLHLASAVNAPVRAVFCSTVPSFGFGPVSDDARVVEICYDLYCRPCGLHGHKACPEKHFRCARKIRTTQFFDE